MADETPVVFIYKVMYDTDRVVTFDSLPRAMAYAAERFDASKVGEHTAVITKTPLV